ncbi:MAG: hypothetical protein R2867_02080 [Caldilineaceae bacterium]
MFGAQIGAPIPEGIQDEKEVNDLVLVHGWSYNALTLPHRERLPVRNETRNNELDAVVVPPR